MVRVIAFFLFFAFTYSQTLQFVGKKCADSLVELATFPEMENTDGNTDESEEKVEDLIHGEALSPLFFPTSSRLNYFTDQTPSHGLPREITTPPPEYRT